MYEGLHVGGLQPRSGGLAIVFLLVQTLPGTPEGLITVAFIPAHTFCLGCPGLLVPRVHLDYLSRLSRLSRWLRHLTCGASARLRQSLRCSRRPAPVPSPRPAV